MKNFFVMFIIMLCIAMPEISAQRTLPGQRGIELTSGTVNGMKPQDGFCAGISLSQYAKGANKWVFGVEYLEKCHPYKDIKIPQSQFTAEGGYYLTFLSDASKTVFLSASASLAGGYESVNWGRKHLFDGATIESESNFLYGGIAGFEVETFLSDRLVFLISARERILFGSSINTFSFVPGIGIKFIIN